MLVGVDERVRAGSGRLERYREDEGEREGERESASACARQSEAPILP